MARYFIMLLALAAVVPPAESSAEAADRPDTVRTVFMVEGMHCDGCSSTIKGTLERMDGVVEASADHEKGSAEALYNFKKATPEDLKQAIEKLGYTVTAMETTPAGDS